jgi:nicotinamidase/pyrazinamidase
MSKLKIDLMIIDPQNDFCDIPQDACPYNPMVMGERIMPALPVTGAHDDMLRLASFIRRVGNKLNDIHVTLDSHNPVDIAHPSWWVNAQRENPAPFTIITASDVKAGLWRTANPLAQAYSQSYVEKLETGGRYPLVIWPEHCLIGGWGHNVHAAVKGELDAWARKRLEVVNYVTKGSNPMTEHYSAVQAEVPDPADNSTLLNTSLIRTLERADIIVVAGEALSHCVANTVRDIANNFGEDNIKKMVLLTDCASPVTGFEQLGKDFVAEMSSRGMQLASSADFLA